MPAKRNERRRCVLLLMTLSLSVMLTEMTILADKDESNGRQIDRAISSSRAAAMSSGDLDQTFGDGGKTTLQFFGSSAAAYAGTLQPDGKIIAAGFSSTPAQFALARLLPDGNVDPSFGTFGRVTTRFSGPNEFAYARAVALQADSKIVAGGIANNDSGVREFALVRYLPNGALDSSFGSSGKVRTSISAFNDQLNALAIQPDGRIIAVGTASVDFAVVRYNADGTLDNSFGSAGKVLTDFFGNDDGAEAVAIQSDGKILVAGWVTTIDQAGGIRTRFGIVRYTPDGIIDTGFGSAGRVVTLFTNEFLDHEAFSVLVQPDNRVIVAGWAIGPQGGADFALARYASDGTLDPTFGDGGKVTTDFENRENERIRSMVLQPDGKIVAAGFHRASNERFALARYNPDGTLDSSFGSGGKVTTVIFSGGFHSQIHAVTLQPDGKIVGIGYAFFTNGNHMTIARYVGDSVVVPTPTPTPTPTPNPSPTPTPGPLQLLLRDPSLVLNQVAALDSILLIGDPFTVINPYNLFTPSIDPNTRVVIFVRNLQLLPGEQASSVIVRFRGSNNQNRDIQAEDVRPVPNVDFAQVVFRLPDGLPADDYDVSVIAHAQISNSGIMRIR